MENEREEVMETERPAYVPRPRWQIIAAWIGVGVVAAGFALYLWHIAAGGRI